MGKEKTIEETELQSIYAYRATNEWNSLPNNVINSNTVVEFKKFLSQGIFKVNKYHYNSSC